MKELWATYSVEDHLNPRALAADILLFDRLVFPVPETPSIPANSGPDYDPGPVDWIPDPKEVARWKTNGWDPEGQSRLLKLLEKVIRKVPWDIEHQERWREEVKKLPANLPDYAFVATRNVTTRDLPSYVTGVAAVGPAYRTVADIERELGVRDASGLTKLPASALATVLGWEFLAPDPDDKTLSDEALLKAVVKFVTEDDEFKPARRAFLDWQQQNFLTEGKTDRESIERAVEQMSGLHEKANIAAKRLKTRTVVRHAFHFAPAVLGLIAASTGFGLVFAAGGCFLSAGGIAVEQWFHTEPGQPGPAAFVQHVNRHFGWNELADSRHRPLRPF
jgi:hypothetical protein